jgi:hypothetical protein
MKTNKKLLISFLALNAVLSANPGGAEKSVSSRYDRMYNSVVKNIGQGKSNRKNYEMIEQLLNQKNKELKDLYLQGEYVVKPEYLEWQIFFSGFYDEYGEDVDNTSENAAYHTRVSGYYDNSGNYVTTSGSINGMTGKPYKPLQQPKDINLGVSIPLKGLSRDPLNLNLSPAQEIAVNPNTLNVTPPSGVTVPVVNPINFQPIAPDPQLPSLANVPNITVPGTGGGNGGYVGYFPGATGEPDHNAFISQMDLISGRIDADFDNSAPNRINYTLTNLLGKTGDNGTLALAGSGAQALNPAVSASGFASASTMQAIEKVVDNALTRIGVSGSNPSDLIITLHNNRSSSTYGAQILHYDEHYLGTRYTIDQMVGFGWMTSAEQTELGAKFIDASLSHTTANRQFQYVENNSSWYLSGYQVIGVNLQAHTDGTDNSIFMNRGSITGLNHPAAINGKASQHVIFEFTQGSSNTQHIGFDNTGDIETRAAQSVGYNFYTVSSGGNGRHIVMNSGNFKMYGQENVGVYTKDGGTLTNSKVVLNEPITLLGDSSIGIDIRKQMMFNQFKLKFDIGTEDPRQGALDGSGVNGLENSGNIAGNDINYTDNATGVYVSTPTTFALNDYNINLGSYAQNSIGFRVENGNVTLGDISLPSGSPIVNSIENTGGLGNIGILAKGAAAQVTTAFDTEVKMDSGNLQTALFSDSGGIINNSGNIIISNSNGVSGIIANGTNSKIINTGTTTISGGVYDDGMIKKGSVGIAVKGSGSAFTSTGNVIVEVSGQESTGLFADTGLIDITGGSIKTLNKAFNLYSTGSTGMIKLNNVTTETGQGSLLFYGENGGKFDLTNVTSTIKGGIDSNNRGTAFYYTGVGTLPPLSVSDLSTYFANTFNGTAGNLTLTMESESRLFIVDNVSIDLSTTSTPLGSIPGGPVVNGATDYKTYMMYKSLLNINQGINLDDTTDAYNNLEIATSSIMNSGQNITGSNTGQAAMGQENGLDSGGTPLLRTVVSLTNNGGNITLSGASSAGMYASYGELRNMGSGIISTTGNNSIGMYGANGSLIDNQAGSTINILNSGVGIYGEGYKQGAAQIFGDGKINITNSGLIQSGVSSNALGIYANNNSTGVVSDAQVNLSNGTVDLGASENAIGVYVDKGTVTDSGSTITVGKNGIALYAKDSNITLTGTMINLNGDNALGLYLDGTTTFTGTGNINIAGQNVVLFNMNSSGIISNNFNVGSVAPGSTYTLGNIVGGAFEYTGSSTLASNGTLVSGVTSAIYLNGSTIAAAPGATNVAAVALDGQYTGILPIGMTSGMDGENNGVIILGDASVGLYGKNGARLNNKGSITVENTSAGLMTSGVNSFVSNSGTITVGTGSQGMYLKDGVYVHNTGTGNILSSGAGTIGIYADNTVNHVTNDGTIDLIGDKSIGIYSTGTSPQIINNNLLVKVGDSVDTSDPSIGIYSAVAGSTVTNAGTVTSGDKSIGIYNNQGTTDNNGTSDIGNAGVGIYSAGGVVNLNAGSAFNMGTNGAVGVYGVYSTVTDSTNLNIGDKNYGFILEGGTLTNASGTNSSIGEDSVYVYSTEGTTVTNNGTLTMSGNNNVGFYMVTQNSSNKPVMINNAGGIILGTAGENNVGIYNYGGTVDNYGTVAVGASGIKFINGTTDVDVEASKYSVGIYGENAAIINHPGADVSAGYGGYGIVAKGGTASNQGTITTTGNYSTGMYTENGVITNETNGIINVSGDHTIGMAGKGTGSKIINHGTINITGNDAIGMYGNLGTIITNTGTINISGLNSQIFVSSDPGNEDHNVISGTANINGVATANVINSLGSVHELPTLINAGIIKINGVAALEGLQVKVMPDPATRQPSSDPDYDFVLSGTSIIADEVLTSKPIVILPGFADGTNANVYKASQINAINNASNGNCLRRWLGRIFLLGLVFGFCALNLNAQLVAVPIDFTEIVYDTDNINIRVDSTKMVGGDSVITISKPSKGNGIAIDIAIVTDSVRQVTT